jgi:N-acetylglutamate synthase-like GNAT family acetyltransferase
MVIKQKMDNELLIRTASSEDMQSAFKLMAELGYPNLTIGDFATTYSSVQENPAMTLLLAEYDGEVVGLASITRRPQLRLAGDLITIDELVVSDKMRGLGVGRRMLERITSTCRDLGARRLELETNRTRESYERRFYVKNGFTEANSAVMRIDFNDPSNP